MKTEGKRESEKWLLYDNMNVTTVIVNYQTPDLLEIAVTSFKEKYPGVELVIIDNGSKDQSPEFIQKLTSQYSGTVRGIFLDENIYHGPAMDYAIRNVIPTAYTFFLDSDTETTKAGFLEEMLKLVETDDCIYGVGEVLKVNKRGFKDDDGDSVLATPFMLLKNEIYLDFPPFEHHGQPTLKNFNAAKEAGYKLLNYNIQDFIHHKWRGTADRYGYGLGWKGKIDYLLNKMGL